MPIATAQARLCKLVLFELVQQAARGSCFVCGLPIETPDELSIEHKQPWRDRDAALFWSLDNIAFSHRRCNRPHWSGDAPSRRKVGPPGTAWCGGHRAFLATELFGAKAARWNGLQDRCKECVARERRARRPSPEPRRCIVCSRTPDEVPFRAGRLLCLEHYNDRQRDIMRQRRMREES